MNTPKETIAMLVGNEVSETIFKGSNELIIGQSACGADILSGLALHLREEKCKSL